LWQNFHKQRSGTDGRPGLSLNSILRRMAQRLSCGWGSQQSSNRRCEFFPRLQLNAGIGFFESLYDVSKIPGVWAEDDNRAERRWFDHVLSSAVSEAATHESNVR